MCLILTVRVPASERDALSEAARSLPRGALRVEITPVPRHAPRWRWVQPQPTEATVSESGGCACSLLSDEADWDAETWAMRPEVREPLAWTLEALVSATSEGAVVEALWVGEQPTREERVTPTALADVARAGSLGTRTRYVVSDAPAT